MCSLGLVGIVFSSQGFYQSVAHSKHFISLVVTFYVQHISPVWCIVTFIQCEEMHLTCRNLTAAFSMVSLGVRVIARTEIELVKQKPKLSINQMMADLKAWLDGGMSYFISFTHCKMIFPHHL